MKKAVHGYAKKGSVAPEYRAWQSMKARCYKEYDKRYETHGARGIIVCERWLNSFENFIYDMGSRPSKDHSLDRRDNNGHYEPYNCKWSTDMEQCRNRRSNRHLTYNGITMLLQDWADFFGVRQSAICNLFRKGYSFDKIASYYYEKYIN